MAAKVSEKGVALVTGSAQGIGREIALKLASDGFDVAVNDLKTPRSEPALEAVKKEIEALGRRSHLFFADVSDEPQVEAMVKSVVGALGSLDVVCGSLTLFVSIMLLIRLAMTDPFPHFLAKMVANAGITYVKSLLDTTVDDFDRVMRINARSVFLAYKHGAKQMLAQGRGGRLIGELNSLFLVCMQLVC